MGASNEQCVRIEDALQASIDLGPAMSPFARAIDEGHILNDAAREQTARDAIKIFQSAVKKVD